MAQAAPASALGVGDPTVLAQSVCGLWTTRVGLGAILHFMSQGCVDSEPTIVHRPVDGPKGV